ncbi:DUF736 domain-containing protein [Xinfangfangia sp. D13-10-4-6]|uniref:DUF736 domain-containing protein n=1 Tax=Pseudogemmobacter hezensis TaxID=2737662 RepID=UPI0015529AD3|nr:DUF736 domain-containing protein [Pseudogemmobacter hezensis]NPD17486.1 DUF736 domain-containing protein [Pseudogemmobacter hezensis]
MAQIGHFTKTTDGYAGRVRTLALDAELLLVPVRNGDSENAPDYRIHLDDAEGPEVGAAWQRTGEKAGEYLSMQIDDPSFAQPIRANLFREDDAGDGWILTWNRPSRRDGKD